MLDAADEIELQLLNLPRCLCTQAEEHIRRGNARKNSLSACTASFVVSSSACPRLPQVRNLQRLEDWRKRANKSAYGAGALAGNTLGLIKIGG